jgi:hypothetical protein
MVQRGAGKHDQWQGYMTNLVVNYGSIKSISKLNTVIRLMIKFDVDKLQDYFHWEVNWRLGIRQQLLSLSA